MISDTRRLGVRLAVRCFFVSALAVGATYSAVAQTQAAPFGPDDSEVPDLAPQRQRGYDLEQRFRESEDWVFYHSISDLPSDMRTVLFRLAGSAVVGPGESFNVIDEADYPGRTQHQYTAVTDDLGVVVWYSGGWLLQTHAVIYDRNVRDAARFNLGNPGNLNILRADILSRIRAVRGTQLGYDYLPPDFFADQ